MDDAQIAALQAENDELYAALGKESPRKKAERKAQKAAEAHQRELEELEAKALPDFLESLEAQSLRCEWEAIDQLDELICERWGALAELRNARRAARDRMAQFTETFGGSLPASWEQARQEWLAKQQQSPDVSSAKVKRRQRVARVVETHVGRYRH